MKNSLGRKILLAAIFCACANLAQAGVVVGGTRVVYDAGKREMSLSVKNPDKIPYLIQSWTDADGPTGENTGSPKPPFVVTPPLFRLDPGNENLLRIIRTGGSLPEDRETVYWMNVKSIPASSSSDRNVLQISVKTRIKMFYRPSGLSNRPEESYKTVSFRRQGNKLQVTNPSPYYISFFSLKVGNLPITTTNVMVPPKGSATYPMPSTASGSQVSWQAINDFGGSSVVMNSQLQ